MPAPRLLAPLLAAALFLLPACSPRTAGAPTTGTPSAGTSAPGNGAQPAAAPSGQLEKVDLAFCSQLMCVLPFEVAKKQGFFAAEGLDVNLIYMKGGPLAVNALNAKSVDFISASMESVLQAVDQGKEVVFLSSTSQLPLFALVTAPSRAAAIQSLRDLAGKKVGVGNLGTSDHMLARHLLTRQGLKAEAVEFVPLGPNIYQALKNGTVDAAMVQEPALTLTSRDGGRVLANLMDHQQAQELLGGTYQHMALTTRPDVLQRRPDLARKLTRALIRANQYIATHGGGEVAGSIPPSLVAGGDPAMLGASLDRVKNHLYPTDGRVHAEAVARVLEVLRSAGALQGKPIDPNRLIDNRFAEEVSHP